MIERDSDGYAVTPIVVADLEAVEQKVVQSFEKDSKGFAVTPPAPKQKKRRADPAVVFTGEALEAFESLPPEIQEQVLAATTRVAETQLVATVPVTRRAGVAPIQLIGVATYNDIAGNYTAMVPIDVVLNRGDVLEIRVKRAEQ